MLQPKVQRRHWNVLPSLPVQMKPAMRANDAAMSAVRQWAQVTERLAALSAETHFQAGNGIEERRDEIEGRLETARATEARFS